MSVIISGDNGISDVDGSAGTPAIRGTDANTGIFFGADQVGVATNGVERVEFGNSETVFNDGGADVDFRVEGDTDANLLFVDASTDRIGIGTSTPLAQLHLSGSVAGARVERTGSSDAGYRSKTTLGDFVCGTGIGSATNCWNIYDITASAERMRIDSSGNLNVGRTVATTSNTVGCSVLGVGAIIAERDNDVCMSLNRLNGNGIGVLFSRGAGNSVGNITLNTSTTTYNTSSDYRLKENIAPMTGALATVSQLQPCTWSWKVDGAVGQGFIAHELQEVAPYAVTGEKDGEEMQGVDYGKITPLLTAALQEAIAKIETLEARIAVLEAK